MDTTWNNTWGTVVLQKLSKSQLEEKIAHGWSINTRDETGSTLLHKAVRYGNLELVKNLLDLGISVNTQDNNGDTPLLSAAIIGDNTANKNFLQTYFKQDYAIIRTLLNHNADVNIPNKQGETPLHCAVENLDVKEVKLFLDAGANVKAQDTEGHTPRQWAEILAASSIIELLTAAEKALSMVEKISDLCPTSNYGNPISIPESFKQGHAPTKTYYYIQPKEQISTPIVSRHYRPFVLFRTKAVEQRTL